LTEYDAVVVGAGILGLSTAYHIKRENPETKILVLDKLNAAGQANTAKSASAFRCLFSSKTNFILADSSIEFYRNLQEKLKIDLKLRFVGYLWLLSEEGYKEKISIIRGLVEEGVGYKEYDVEELTQKMCMRTDLSSDEEARLMKLRNVYKGILITKAGILDADSIVRFYEGEFLRLGGKIEYGVCVKNLLIEPHEPLGIFGEPHLWQKSGVTGLNTDRGFIKAKKSILATGAWTSQLLDEVGIECYIKPKKRQIFPVPAKSAALQQLLFTKGFNQYGCLPFTILPGPDIYIRPFPDENVFWVGCADEFPRAFKLEEKPQVEKDFYEYGIQPVITKYFPQFKDCRPSSPFAGQYAINTLDSQPAIFEEGDLIVVSGASGSGIMKADAIGRIAAALYAGEEYAVLYGNRKFKVSDLGFKNRKTEPEKLVL
jgi:glycine/D-amino acid oxidase-like deaminating enzyme